MTERTIGPHAAAFGTYLAMMTAGLMTAGSPPYLALYAGLLGLWAWLVSRRMTTMTEQEVRRESIFYAVAMNITFQAMGGAIPAIRDVRYDSALLGVDLLLFPISPNVWTERFVTPLLTDVLSLCYLFFMPLLFTHLARYFFWQKELLDTFFRGLFTVYGIGFAGYLWVPAAGPYLTYPEIFTKPLVGGAITDITQTMVVLGSNRVDVFPSLHCAISAYILGFSWRHHRRQFWWLLLPVCGLWLSTIYLRYHYMIDVIFGFALAILALTLIRRSPTDLT